MGRSLFRRGIDRTVGKEDRSLFRPRPQETRGYDSGVFPPPTVVGYWMLDVHHRQSLSIPKGRRGRFPR